MNREEFMNQKVKDMTIRELEIAITYKKRKWINITDECEFKICEDSSGWFYFEIYHDSIVIGYICSIIEDNNGIRFLDSDYKVVFESEDSYHFKIMRKLL